MDKRLKIIFWTWASASACFTAYVLISTMGRSPGITLPQMLATLMGSLLNRTVLAYAGCYFFLAAGLRGDPWGKLFFVLFILSDAYGSISKLTLFHGSAQGIMVADAWFNLVAAALLGVNGVMAMNRRGSAASAPV